MSRATETERVQTQAVQILLSDLDLRGDLAVPAAPSGLVMFAHGSGSSRHSPRNRAVASELHRAGLATLLIDLLTDEESAVDQVTPQYRFDIDLLAARLVVAAQWIKSQPSLEALPLGLFGASTGAAAALQAAARLPGTVRAVVCRGGRPDLAYEYLRAVLAPTRLIVGELDRSVLALNHQALTVLGVDKDLLIVPGAGHLFEEPGALLRVAHLAAEWFIQQLRAERSPSRPAAAQRQRDVEGGW
jgi:dienelactone hydrolase